MEKPSAIRAWLLTTRPKTLTAALTPVLVGTALAWYLQASISWKMALLTTLMALLIQIGINFINDALDFRHGVDTAARIGFARATQQGWLTFRQVLLGGWAAFALALLCALPLAWQAGWIVFAIACVCVVFGYLYTGGPYPLSYLGLSDPFVLFFFGILATTTTAYIQLLTWPASGVIAGLQLGLLAMAISAINNLRDIAQDRLANKKTLPVRFGIAWARAEIALALLLPFVIGSYWWVEGLPVVATLPMVALPQAGWLAYAVYTTAPGRAYNGLLAKTALLLLAFGLLLAAALYFSR